MDNSVANSLLPFSYDFPVPNRVPNDASQQQHSRITYRHGAPTYHVAPEEGWINDPNGPLYYNGAYHMFYQHLPGSAVWGFNLVWGHATSKDLIHWEVMPHAIEPTPGGLDGDGCFSGCAAIDKDGKPVLLYTGVRLRGSALGGPLPPPECDLGLPFVESQCLVYAEDHNGDWRLPYWKKMDVPILALPPPDLKLAGWRDPYIVGPPNGHPEHGYTMLIGSGIKEQGGTVLQYRSHDLTHGWQFAGELCSGGVSDGTGIVWECPLLVELPIIAAGDHQPTSVTTTEPAVSNNKNTNAVQPANDTASNNNNTQVTSSESSSVQPGNLYHRCHWFCFSPDACTNPTLYYLGDYVDQWEGEHPQSTTLPGGPAIAATPGVPQGKFLITEALGPFRLDLGDILYAPNTLLDKNKGRVLLWAWLQEARKVAGTYSYAGCLSIPRELWLQYDEDPTIPRLHQRPVPEISQLRLQDRCWMWPPRRKPAPKGVDSTSALKLNVAKSAAFGDSNINNVLANMMMLGDSTGGVDKRGAGLTSLSPFQAMDLQEQVVNNLANGLLNGHAVSPAGAPKQPRAKQDEQEPTEPAVPDLIITPGEAYPVPIVQSLHLDIELQLQLLWPEPGEERNSNTTGDGSVEIGATASQSTVPTTSQTEGSEAGNPATVSDGIPGRVGDQHVAAEAPPPVGACSGVVLRVWQAGAEGAAAILYCWATQVLEVVFEALDPETHEFSLAAPGCRRVGGKLRCPPTPGQPLSLRLLIDHSLVEVFTGGGEVLTTRVYRGTAPPGEGAGIDLVSLGCCTRVVAAAAYEMNSCWLQTAPLPVPVSATAAATAAAAATSETELDDHASLLQITGALLQEKGWNANAEKLVRMGSGVQGGFVTDILSRMSSGTLAQHDTTNPGMAPQQSLGGNSAKGGDRSGGLSSASSLRLPASVFGNPAAATALSTAPQTPRSPLISSSLGTTSRPGGLLGMPSGLPDASLAQDLPGSLGRLLGELGSLPTTPTPGYEPSPSLSLLAAETGELWSKPVPINRRTTVGGAPTATLGSLETRKSYMAQSPPHTTFMPEKRPLAARTSLPGGFPLVDRHVSLEPLNHGLMSEGHTTLQRDSAPFATSPHNRPVEVALGR